MNQDFPFAQENKESYNLSFYITSSNNNNKIFQTLWKNPSGTFYPHFAHFRKIQIFPKNLAPSLLSLYCFLTSCTTLKNKRVSGKVRHGRTDEGTDEQPEKWTDRQTWIHRTLPQGGGSRNTWSQIDDIWEMWIYSYTWLRYKSYYVWLCNEICSLKSQICKTLQRLSRISKTKMN